MKAVILVASAIWGVPIATLGAGGIASLTSRRVRDYLTPRLVEDTHE